MASEARPIAAAGGPALFQGPDADHWARLLVREHLDAPGRLALLRTCQHARNLVLANAAQFTVTLRLYESDEDGPARCEAAQRLLRRRGGAHTTTLVLHADDNMTTLAFVLHTMREEMGFIDTLELRGWTSDNGYSRPAISSALLQLLPRHWRPNIRALRVLGLMGRLVDPALLPGLAELHIQVADLDWPEIHTNIAAPYAHCLRTLRMGEITLMGPQVEELRDAAPNLVDLEVEELYLIEDDWDLGTRAFSWRRLTVHQLRLSSLIYWPFCELTVLLSKGRHQNVAILFDVDSEAEAKLVIEDAARSTFLFDGPQVWVPVLPEEDENQEEGQQVDTTLLFKHGLAAIRGLRGFHDPGTEPPPSLLLDGWRLSREAVGHLQWLPPWTRLHFNSAPNGAFNWDHEDSLEYRNLLRLLPPSFRVIRFVCAWSIYPYPDQAGVVFRGLGTPTRPFTIETVEIKGKPGHWLDEFRTELKKIGPVPLPDMDIKIVF